jgi:hypothetical protein
MTDQLPSPQPLAAGGAADPIPFAPGATLSLPGMTLRIGEIGKRAHSAGYGDVDFTVVLLAGEMSVGTIVNTPWGHGEIIAVEATPNCVWRVAADKASLDLQVGSETLARVSVWSDQKGGDVAWWNVHDADGKPIERILDTLAEACAAATWHAGVVLPPPANLLSAYEETSATPAAGPTDMMERLAKMLAEVIDSPLLTVNDIEGGPPRELRVASFQPALGRRAAALLEEAGY